MTSSLAAFTTQFAACPLIAIIRGVTPGEVEAVGDALVEAGIRIIEVPLNSPGPLVRLESLDQRLGDVRAECRRVGKGGRARWVATH